MKKITIITSKNKSKGGANVAALRIADILKKKFHIKIVSPNKANLIGKVKYYFARVIIKIFIGKTKYLNSLNIFSRVDSKKINGDLIHLNWIGEETISLNDIEKIDKPILWTLHDMWPVTSTEHFLNSPRKKSYSKKIAKKNLLKYFIYKKKKKFFKKNINIITNSKWLENFAKKSDLTKSLNIKTIYNPIDTKSWYRVGENFAKKKLDLHLSKKYILFGAHGGFQNYRKGGDLFLESFSKLKNLNKEIEVIVLGGSQNQIKKINHVNFHFRKLELDNNIQRLYHSVPILTVSSARAESLPQFIVETILCKNPVVAFNVGGINEIVFNKFNGYLSKCYDTDDFAKGIKYCINNIKKNNLSKARKIIYKNFNQKKILMEYEKFINKII